MTVTAPPVALGVIYCDPRPSCDQLVQEQAASANGGTAAKNRDLNALLRSGYTWQVGA